MPKVKIVETDNWMTIYVDSMKVYDNHSDELELDWLLKHPLGIPVDHTYTDKPRVFVRLAPDSRAFHFKAPCAHDRIVRLSKHRVQCEVCEEEGEVNFG